MNCKKFSRVPHAKNYVYAVYRACSGDFTRYKTTIISVVSLEKCMNLVVLNMFYSIKLFCLNLQEKR